MVGGGLREDTKVLILWGGGEERQGEAWYKRGRQVPAKGGSRVRSPKSRLGLGKGTNQPGDPWLAVTVRESSP